MVCSLNRSQQEGILEITRNILQKEPKSSTEDILKKVYDVGYHLLINSGKTTAERAQEYGVVFVQYVAEKLDKLAQDEKANSILSKFGVDLNTQATANSLLYTKENEVKKLVGINTIQGLKRNTTKFSKPDQTSLQEKLNQIKESFPKLGEPKIFARGQVNGKNVDAVQLRTMEGDKPYFHVSLFSKNDAPRVTVPSVNNGYLIPEGAGFVEPLAYGNMVDYAVRQIFKNPNKSFEAIKELLSNDENLVNSFSAYSLAKTKPEENPKASPAFNAYFDQFLNDMLITASKIETSYEGYRITDLSDIIDNSSMTKEQKDSFYIYSNKLGLIGEVDLLAIKPDGTFKVVDIKTAKDGLNEVNKKAYMTQISSYTHILAEATGLKAEGNADILLVEKSFRNVMNAVKDNDPSNRNKVVLTNVQVVSEPLISVDEIANLAEKYREEKFRGYTAVDKVTPQTKEKINILNPYEAFKRSQQSKGKPLNQNIVASEDMSTRESVKQQAEWLQKVFPELEVGKSLKIVPSLASNTGGQFFLDMIILAEKSNQGVGYHEGWHRFSQLYLTKQEKIDLYSKVRDSNLNFTDREGNNVNTKDADFKQIEEFLAEEFRKYAMNPKDYSFPKNEVKGVFARIWQFLKSVLNYFKNGGINSYEKLFKQLNDGNFYKGNYSIENHMFSTLNSFYRNSKSEGDQVMSDQKFLQYKDFADGYLNEYMMNNGILLNSIVNKQGISTIYNILKDGFSAIRDSINDVSATAQYQSTLDDLNKILGTDSIPSTFEDFMSAYLKTTNYETLRKYVGANQELVANIIEKERLTPPERSQEEGEEIEENTAEEGNEELKEFNRSGNEVPAYDLASSLVKDFFNGIPELSISGAIPSTDSYRDYTKYTNVGLPIYINKSKAFSKSMEILAGNFTWDLIEKEMSNTDNYEKFPELQVIKEKLFGENGIITRLNAVTEELKDPSLSPSDVKSKLEEQRKLKEFKNQFQHVMTLSHVRPETVFLNFENSVSSIEDDKNKKFSVLGTRENSESILTSIVNGFRKGFQENARKAHEDRIAREDGSFVDLFDAFNILMNGDEFGDMALSSSKYFYNGVMKQYHFNPFYVLNNFSLEGTYAENVEMSKIKELFEILGINLNQNAYTNSEADIRKAYKKLGGILNSYTDYLKQTALQLQTPTKKGRSWAKEVTNLNSLKDELRKAYEASPIDDSRVSELEIQIVEKKRLLRDAASKLLSPNPIDELLYLGQDRKTKLDDYQKIFAINLPTLLDVAKIQKQYRDHFSSGAVMVAGKLQFSYFLPNQLLLVSNLINHGVQSFDDFDKYPEIQHLNPNRNTQFRNSFIINQLFDNKGNKIPGRQFVISSLTQTAINWKDGRKEEKRFSELTADEKLLMDLLLNYRDGSSEIRRMETSNTAYRMAVVDTSNGEYKFIKPVTIGKEKFADPSFTEKIFGYLQASVFKYVYDSNNEQTSKVKDKASLSVFEQILGSELSTKFKDYIDTLHKDNPNFDWNNIFDEMQSDFFEASKPTDKLVRDLGDKIVQYFEGITISNEDSVLNEIGKTLSEKSKGVLLDLANKYKGKTYNGDIVPSTSEHNNFNELLTDKKFQNMVRDFIANDFINAMEDSLLLFGDYTYYKDPIKRRKIIGNNGVLGIVDSSDSEIEKQQVEKGGILGVYREAKGLPEETDKDYRLVRKSTIADIKAQSKLLKDGTLLSDLRDFYKQVKGRDLSDEEIRSLKTNIFDAFSEMELADAGAYVSLDLYRRLRQKADNWTDADEDEFDRQKLIFRQKLGKELTEEEQQYVDNGPYSEFNIAKFALTGPVYSKEHSPLKPTFDKMGLKVMLPETDWDTKRHLFEHMMDNAVDYIVYDSGSKGYQSEIHDVWDKSKFTVKGTKLDYVEHASGFMKLQQNTASVKDDSTFAVQLRGTFFSLMVLNKQANGEVNPQLKNLYNDFLTSMKDYVQLMGEKELSNIGLDKEGNFITDEKGVPIGKRQFVEKIREKLLQIGSTDLSLLDKLDIDKKGDFVNFLEALPLSKEINNIVSGILDDGFRKVRLNGSKMYQTMELGSYDSKMKPEERGEGTIGLKWHGLIRDKKGKIIGVSPVEAKIAFKKNFHPLLQLKDNKGNKIGTLNRLNQMLKNSEWVDKHKEKLTMVGIRIPLQDLNFTSHMIIKEFLPETEGDNIIVPPEFYKQVGSDNDIDTITTSFKYLDKHTGEVVKKPTDSYSNIINKIVSLKDKNSNQGKIVKPEDKIQSRINAIRTRIMEENIFSNAGKSTQDLDQELAISEDEGFKTFVGLTSNKSTLGKLFKNSLHQDILTELSEIVDDMNNNTKAIKNTDHKELLDLYKKRNNYIKGINNNILSPIIKFLEQPESFDYLTETDTINPIEQLAKYIIHLKTGKAIDSIKLNDQKSALDDIGYLRNLTNHTNNAQVRTMLGSFVKFSRILTTLVQLDTKLNTKYQSSGIDNLAQNKSKNFYTRHIWTPLLSKVVGETIPLSLYDEKGERITKNLSMISSSLLDLFKNLETFPSLNISWNNIKPLIFLMAQGVEFKKAITFINNPIVQMIEQTKNELGSDYQLRHAIVKTSQDAFGNAIHGDIFEYQKNGMPNQEMKRQAKAGEKFLDDKFKNSTNEFKLNMDEMETFISDFNEFKRKRNRNSANDLELFLKKDGAKYKELAENTMAYYSTLVEDGDHFYQMLIKKLDRDSAKYNSKAQIVDGQRVENAITHSKFVNTDFLDKLKTQSVFAPFYNDKIVENVLNSTLPKFYNKNIPGWIEGVQAVVSRIVSEKYGNSELKRSVESRVISDLMDFLYKNFYVMKFQNKDGKMIHNFPYEFFEKSILPELNINSIHKTIYGKDKEINTDQSSLSSLKGKLEEGSLDYLSGHSLFANQIDFLRAKYPELANLLIFQALQPKRTSPQLEYEPPAPPEDLYNENYNDDDEGFGIKKGKPKRNITISEMFNTFSQVYLTMNLNTDPQTRFIEEQQVREEWLHLLQFTPEIFPSVSDAIKPERRGVYEDKNNIEEIRTFFNLLSYYSLVQNSHMDRATGSFAYLSPVEKLKDSIETTLSNFEQYAKDWTPTTIANVLMKFEQTFRQMNPDLELKIDREGGVGYKAEKVKSGKLYSKVTIGNQNMDIAKNSLLKNAKGELGYNNFLVDTETEKQNAFTNDNNCF